MHTAASCGCFSLGRHQTFSGMVKFLLHRPIAVITTFLALIAVGLVCFGLLPVSLLPDVSIPHIVVKVDAPGKTPRQIESSCMLPLRRALAQVEGIEMLESESGDGYGTISITMDYGRNMDLAFIAVNEKIDATAGLLPRDIPRPLVVKTSVSDIPALYLQITRTDGMDPDAEFYTYVMDVVRRRLEQLPEVAMVDVSGVPTEEIDIRLHPEVAAAAGITASDIAEGIGRTTGELSGLEIARGRLRYRLHMSEHIDNLDAIGSVGILKNGRIYRLGDICDVLRTQGRSEGLSTYMGKRAVTFAVVKKSTAGMDKMEEAVGEAVALFRANEPEVDIQPTRSQRSLLDAAISNLEQDLLFGLLLVFGVCIVFLRNVRVAFVIGITMIVSVIITFGTFHFVGLSINIISLAGLILAVGMMIDNSVIIAENISQYRHKGLSLGRSCSLGTTELVTPLLSSTLTTIAVFVPLVFMSGIAGAIFKDQALALSVGLLVSYAVGLTLLPVLYLLLMRRDKADLKEIGTPFYIRWYDIGTDWCMRHKALSIGIVLAATALIPAIYPLLEMTRMPHTRSSEAMLHIDWNSNIDASANRLRADSIGFLSGATEYSAFAGVRDFLIDNDGGNASGECELYFRGTDEDDLHLICARVDSAIVSLWPDAGVEWNAAPNPFEQVFASRRAPLTILLHDNGADNVLSRANSTIASVKESTGVQARPLKVRPQIVLEENRDLMARYGVSQSDIRNELIQTFSGMDLAGLDVGGVNIPVRVKTSSTDTENAIDECFVRPTRGNGPEIPLRMLISSRQEEDLKTVTAGTAGEYVALSYDANSGNVDRIIESARSAAADNGFDATFEGAIFDNERMLRELSLIMLVSLILMYFVLCAQFESFVQPLIVLVEIPVDLGFALLSLWIFGQSLNLMSAIGIIVTCGIVVNDSILKLDSINELRRKGTPLTEAIHTAGHRRLKSILMTSLTTILAMLPLLFTHDLGSDLQRPMSIAMIGSMIPGTIVSIFAIPLCYYMIYRKKDGKTN